MMNTPERVLVRAPETISLARVRAGGQTCAIDARHVREIVAWQPVTPLPDAPVLIEGVVELRGALVPVTSLARVLGAEPAGPAETTSRERIVILAFEALVLGLRVEAVLDVLHVAPEALEAPPALTTRAARGTRAEAAAVSAVLRQPHGTPLPVLCIEHVLDVVRRSGAGAAGVSP